MNAEVRARFERGFVCHGTGASRRSVLVIDAY